MPLYGSMLATHRAACACRCTLQTIPRRKPVGRGQRKSSGEARECLTSTGKSRRTRFLCRASGAPVDEGDEGPEFSELNIDSEGGLGGTSDSVFGPRAILLIGCATPEIEFFESVVAYACEHWEALSLVVANKKILEGKLSDAFSGDESAAASEPPPLGVRRVVIFSGMDTREVLEFIGVYKDSGLPRAVFAAAVPNNWDHNVAELVEEVCSDDRMMQQQQREQEPSKEETL